MKRILYIFVPLIALSLVASNAWSAKAPQAGSDRPGMERPYDRGGSGQGRPGGMRGGPSTGLRAGKGGPSTALRAGGKLGIPRGRWWNRTRVQASLKLTDKQIERLEKISLEGRKNMIKQRADLEIAELELEPLMEAKKFDRDKVEDVLDKLDAIRAKMAKERHKTLLDTREVLSSEQYKKLKEFKRPRWGNRKRPRRQQSKLSMFKKTS